VYICGFMAAVVVGYWRDCLVLVRDVVVAREGCGRKEVLGSRD
jgi:hypothetical protein